MTDPDTLEPVRTNEVRWRGRTLLHFSGCDYFRMARHPALRAAARSVLSGRGLNVAASRLTTGNHPIYGQLELELARWFDCESAVVLPDGYLAPVAAAQALTGDFTHALIDEASHGALVDASRMLDCPVIQFKHRDALDLAQLVLNWTIQRSGITAALCGAKRPDQIRDNAEAMNWQLSSDQIRRIDQAIIDRGPVVSRAAV